MKKILVVLVCTIFLHPGVYADDDDGDDRKKGFRGYNGLVDYNGDNGRKGIKKLRERIGKIARNGDYERKGMKRRNGDNGYGKTLCEMYPSRCQPNGNSVPEFNGASGILGLGLVLALGALIRDRRRRK